MGMEKVQREKRVRGGKEKREKEKEKKKDKKKKRSDAAAKNRKNSRIQLASGEG